MKAKATTAMWGLGCFIVSSPSSWSPPGSTRQTFSRAGLPLSAHPSRRRRWIQVVRFL